MIFCDIGVFDVLISWVIVTIIITPVILLFCKAAKKGDKGNKLINNGYKSY